jgi:CheY-like chemotaxis protein
MQTPAIIGNAPQPLAVTLLVDRDADTRRMYAEYLSRAACIIEEAEDGREALAKAITHHPDIVVTDTRLPGISGFELCTLLRTDVATRDVPIVFVTGDAVETELQHAQDVGADTILVKPCLPETLYTEMQRLLAQSSDLRARARAVRARVKDQLERSDKLLAASRNQAARRMTLSRAHIRQQTTAPAQTPPTLVCPSCDQPLTYTRSHTGGVNARSAEQWDYYDCPVGCGTFQYRQRTRRLRKVS